MALNKDWRNYNPDTGVGDPSTPITAEALEDLEARALAAINAAVAAGAAAGRTVYTLPGTAIVLTSAHHNAEIVTTAATPVTVRVPLNWGGTGAISTGIRQDGAGTVTIVWDAGVTVAAPNGTQIRERYSARGAIVKTGTNTYVLEGDFIPAASGGGGGVITPPDGGVSPVDNEGFYANAFTNQASGVGLLVPTAGGTGDRTYVAIVAWDTGSTPDISSLITTATAGWTKREAGYGTGNGGAVFTADVASGGADPATLVLTWTGGNRTSFYAVVGVYDDAEYYESDVRAYATQDATAPIYPSVQVQAGGVRIVAATNNAGLATGPLSGYVERADLNGTATAKYANVTVSALTSKASGALTVEPPPGVVGDTYFAIVYYDNASSGGDASANIILDSSTGDWTKEDTEWQSPQGSAVFWHRVATGDVNPTVQFTGAARGVGYICVRVSDADDADPVLAINSAKNTSSDSSNAIFPALTDNNARALRLLVAINNADAAIAAPETYDQRANYATEGAVFTRDATGVTADIVYVSRSGNDVTGSHTTLPITRPAGSAVGNFHLMVFYAQGDDTSVTYVTPGWTILDETLLPEPVAPDLVGTKYFYRWDDGSSFDSITWGVATNYSAARIVTYANVDPLDPILGGNSQANVAHTNIAAPGLTTYVDGAMLLYIGTTTDGGAVTGPATYTARNTVVYDMQIFEKAQGTAGATGTVTGTQTDASDPSMGALFALRPAKFAATTAVYTGANRLHHDWSILVKPATFGYATLGLQVADRVMTTTGASGVLSPTMAATPIHSNVAFSVSLAPSGTVTDPDPDPDPVDKVVTELSTNGSGVVFVSVPAGTESVRVAELDNIASVTPTFYTLSNDEWLDGNFVYTPHAGTPVVDMEARDVDNVPIPPPPADAWAGRLVTNVINTPPASSGNSSIPPAASITDSVSAVWTLVDNTALGVGKQVYRNGAATISSEVEQILYKVVNNVGTIYQKNIYGGWWYWDNTSTASNPWTGTSDPTGATTPPVTPPTTPPPTTTGFRFGLNGRNELGNLDRSSILAIAPKAGTVIRHNCNAPGDVDAAVNFFNSINMKLLILAHIDTTMWSDATADQWAAKAIQHKASIAGLEMGNELNYNYSPKWGSSEFTKAVQYGQRAIRIYNQIAPHGIPLAVIQEDANSGNNAFTNGMLQGAGSNFLGLPLVKQTIHPYGPEGPGRVLRAINYSKSHGGPNPKFWITEDGISVDDGNNLDNNYGYATNLTDSSAASVFASHVNQIRANPEVEMFLWYQNCDQQNPGTGAREAYFGVVNLNFSDKGALTALARSYMQ